MRRKRYKSPTQVVNLGGKRQAVAQVMEARQQVGETLDLFIYDVIESDGYDMWTGQEIKSETSADWFREQLQGTEHVSRIRLFVNSAGGDVVEAMGIRAQLLRHPAEVIGYVDGWAASAASFVLTACDRVHMLTGSMQFLHNMWTVAAGDSADLRRVADEMDQMMVSNRQMYLERAGDRLTVEKLTELMDAETWLSADESVALGLADDVMAASEYKDIVRQAVAPVQAEIDGVSVDGEPPIHGATPEPDEPPEVADEIRTEPDPPDQEVIEPQDEPANPLAIFMAALVGGEEEE